MNEVYEVPAVVNGSTGELILENLNYLCRNIESTLEYMLEGNAEQERGMDSLADGERDYSYPYSLMEKDIEAYNKKYVLPRYKNNLKNLFDGKEGSMPARKLVPLLDYHKN